MTSTRGIRAGRAFVELFADDSQLVRGLRRAEKRLKAFGDSIRNMGLKIMGLATAMLAPMLAASKAFSSMGDSLAKMARRTGLSVEALSELGFAAGQSGTDLASLEAGLRRMQRTIYDAGHGLSTAKRALADVGLKLEDLDSLSPERQFKLLAEAVSRVPHPSRRAAIAMTLFGRSGTNLLAMLERGAEGIEHLQQEARRLGLTMSSEDARAAEELTDALDKLWKVIRMGVFRIGASLAGVLQQLTERITRVAVTVSAWIDRNRQLIVTVMKVAAAVFAGGLALAALGTLISGLGGALGVLITVITSFAAALKISAAVIAFLVSPIGLVIAAVAALGAYLVYATGIGGKALSWLGERFSALKEDALSAWRGIADALAAGDISLAARILWLTLKMEWQRGVNWLEGMWLGFKRRFLEIATAAFYGALGLLAICWAGLEAAWVETTALMARAWARFTGLVMRSWNTTQGWLAKRWIDLMGLFDSTMDTAEVKRAIDEDTVRLNAEAERHEREDLSAIEERREAGRKRIESERDERLISLDRAERDANRARASAYEKKLAGSEAELARTRREWQEALAAARAARDAVAAGDDALLEVEDYQRSLQSAGMALTGALTGEVAGTFSATALARMGFGSSVAERTAKAAEETAKNTGEVSRKLDGLAFVFE